MREAGHVCDFTLAGRQVRTLMAQLGLNQQQLAGLASTTPQIIRDPPDGPTAA